MQRTQHPVRSRGYRILPGMKAVISTTVLISGLLLSGCFSNNPNAVKEHTADITAAAKRNGGQVVQGIFQGLTRGGPLDLNSASAKDFAKLPGMTPGLSQAIVGGRPYEKPSDLVTKHILTRPQFDRIKAQVMTKPKPNQP